MPASPDRVYVGRRERTRRARARAGLLPWAVAGGSILALQVGSKAVRDGLFLSQVPAVELPGPCRGRAAGSADRSRRVVRDPSPRSRPDRDLAAARSAFLFSLEWVLLPVARWSRPDALLHMRAAAPRSRVFSCISDRFDPHAPGSRAERSRAGRGRRVIGGVLVSLLATGSRIRTLLLGSRWAASAARSGGPIGTAATRPRRAHSRVLRVSSPSRLTAQYRVPRAVDGLHLGAARLRLQGRPSNALGTGPELLQLFAAFHAATARSQRSCRSPRDARSSGLVSPRRSQLAASVLLTAQWGRWSPPPLEPHADARREQRARELAVPLGYGRSTRRCRSARAAARRR